MPRWFVLVFALLLPLQFAWSAASVHCGHERSEAQASHFGHHVHAHQDESGSASGSQAGSDADCAACQAAGAATICARLGSRDFASASTPAAAPVPPRFTSVLARAPDRPQWPRLV